MLKVTVELTESNAPPLVYCLSEGDVKVEYGTREMLSCFGGPPNIDLTGGITITVEGIRANATETRTIRTPREFYGVAKPGEQIISITKGGAMPNWKEAFEEVLARGGNTAPSENCLFCKTSKDCTKDCPLDGAPNQSRITCSDIFGRHYMDDSERRAICRHVFATVKDFTDRNEIRARIAEMLDDPEKFLGKPEPEWLACFVAPAGGGTYSNDGGCGRDDASFPRLTWFVKSCKGASRAINRAGFLTEADARRFLDALPEEEK